MVVVFGSINADLIFPLETLPTPGQTLIADGMSVQPGGKGANQACAAARDGARVVMAGTVGSDSLAEGALALLRKAGADVSRVATVPGATGCAVILTDRAGRNEIVVASGANLAARAACVEDALLGPGTVVLTQMEADPGETAALIVRARRAGARVLHNLAPARAMDRDVLAQVDLLLVNEDEADWLASSLGLSGAKAGAGALAEALGVTVVRTLGGEGVAWDGPGGGGRMAAPKVEVVDTTAAGDCFAGVLAAGLERGEALEAALRRAVVAASLSCTRAGSQGSLPSREETDEFLRRGAPDRAATSG